MTEQLEAEQQPARARKQTLNSRRMSKAELEQLRVLNDSEWIPEQRPRTRGDCLAGGVNACRPCPWAGCRYHLSIDVQPNGGLTINFPDRDVIDLVETCALDVADAGGRILEDVGALMNLTRERVRQLETSALVGISDGDLRALQEAGR